MRLFIAVSLDDEIKSLLFTISENLKKKVNTGSFPKISNYHITLLYIGETENTSAVISALEEINVSPFIISLDEIGRFVGKNESTYWVGLKGQIGMLLCIYETLKSKLVNLGFAFNHSTFTPHITLARKVVGSDQLVNLEVPKATINVSEITLYKSEYKDNTLTYTKLYIKKLK